jgi:hypothetical protein
MLFFSELLLEYENFLVKVNGAVSRIALLTYHAVFPCCDLRDGDPLAKKKYFFGFGF